MLQNYAWTGNQIKKNCGCGRHSINNVTGLPYDFQYENPVLNVFKGSTLTADFVLPNSISNQDVFDLTVVYPSNPALEVITYSYLENNTYRIIWDSNIISELEAEETFRIGLTLTDGQQRNFGEITLKVI